MGSLWQSEGGAQVCTQLWVPLAKGSQERCSRQVQWKREREIAGKAETRGSGVRPGGLRGGQEF